MENSKCNKTPDAFIPNDRHQSLFRALNSYISVSKTEQALPKEQRALCPSKNNIALMSLKKNKKKKL